MTTRRVSLDELHSCVGKYISFSWSDGWDDYAFSGYLHGIDGLDYVYTDDSPELGDRDFAGLGGVRCDSRDRFDVYVVPPKWARQPDKH